MRKLGNVLYITTPEAFLALDGETIVVKKDGSKSLRLPLHNLQGLVCF
jgi:CRISPR-associated protein Cas1